MSAPTINTVLLVSFVAIALLARWGVMIGFG